MAWSSQPKSNLQVGPTATTGLTADEGMAEERVLEK